MSPAFAAPGPSSAGLGRGAASRPRAGRPAARASACRRAPGRSTCPLLAPGSSAAACALTRAACAAPLPRARALVADVRRPWRPELHPSDGNGLREPRGQRRALGELDRVHVGRVVPVVERRRDRPRRADGARPGPRRRSARTRRQAGARLALEQLERREHVEPAPAGERVAAVAALRRSGRRDVGRRALEQPRRPGRASASGRSPSSSAAAAETCGAANDVPIASR